MIEALAGEENVSHHSLHNLDESRFAASKLENRLLNIDDDLPRRSLTETSVFKKLVSGQSVEVEQKNVNFYKITPFSKLVFSANHLPLSGDNSLGFWRRWILIYFPNTFEGANADRELGKALTAPKVLSSLLNLALIGLRRLHDQNGFSEAKSVKTMLDKWRNHSDSVSIFIDEMCEYSGTIVKKTLFNEYKNWTNDCGYKPVTLSDFYARILSLDGVEEDRPDNSNRCFAGISIVRF